MFRPKLLTFRYPPSDTGVDDVCSGLEPVSTVVVVPDRSGRPGIVANCKVEILLVGTPRGQAHFASLAILTTLLGVIESQRPTDPTPLSFLPVGPAHA